MGEHKRATETFGEYLTRERGLRNIRLEEIAQRTRVSLRVLQALEADDQEALPADVYIRGFLKAYARHVGLDENEIVLRYDAQRGAGQEVLRPPGEPWVWPKSRLTWRIPRALPWRWLLMGAAVAALAVGMFLGWPLIDPFTAMEAPEPTDGPPAATSPGPPAPAPAPTPAAVRQPEPAPPLPGAEADVRPWDGRPWSSGF
jgi:cytoskeletal protein RodZ